MEEERTIVEKILAGEVQISNCDLNADFDHEEIRTLLDEHIIEPRHLPEPLASDMMIEGLLSYEEYPFENFTPYEQLRQLDNKAITSEDFWKKIKVDDFNGDDMAALMDHITECRIIIQGEEKKHE